MKATVPAESAAPASFEEAIHELETIVAKMDEGSLGLEQSLIAYRRGAELVKHCQKALEAVRDQVMVLDGEMLRSLSAEDARGGDAAE